MRPWLFVAFALGLVLGASPRNWGQESAVSIVEINDLERYEKQINAMLKTRLDAEKAYVALLVNMIKEGDLPRELVDRAVLWVQYKRPISHAPFVYFAKVLELSADRAHVAVPPFDYNVYSSQERNFK